MARSTRRAALILGIGGALLLPAAATADPGTPGVSAAQDAVYPTSVGPNVLGEQTTPTTPSNPTTPTSVQQPTVAAAQTSPAAGGGGVTSLPFTGLAAAMVLGVALLLLAAGGALRLAARRAAG